MRKITRLVFALCMLLTVTSCNMGTDKTDESSSGATSQPTSATAVSTSDTDAAQQTNQPAEENTTTEKTTSETPSDVVPAEKAVQILKLNEKTIFEYRWSEEDATSLIECEYNAILLCDNDAERFPALATVLMDAATTEEISLKNEYEMLSEAVDEMISMGIELQEPLASKFDAQVRRADNVVLSVLTDCHYNNGMNGGHRSFWGSNYDTQTGETLHLPDIVIDIDAFAQTVEDQLFSTFGADVFYNDGIIKEYFEMYGADGTHWTVDYNGVTVYFDEGEIADIGIGGINATVAFAEHPELFNDKYMSVPENYIVSLPLKYTFNVDLNNDGNCEELTIYDHYDDVNNYNATINIYAENTSYSEKLWANDFKPYYIKAANGKHYLYLFTELETQMYLYVYDITYGTIDKVGEANVSPHYYDGISAILTDPENMHFDIFSDESGCDASDGNDIFSVGVNGMPSQG